MLKVEKFCSAELPRTHSHHIIGVGFRVVLSENFLIFQGLRELLCFLMIYSIIFARGEKLNAIGLTRCRTPEVSRSTACPKPEHSTVSDQSLLLERI